jgi:hypothetical protein
MVAQPWPGAGDFFAKPAHYPLFSRAYRIDTSGKPDQHDQQDNGANNHHRSLRRSALPLFPLLSQLPPDVISIEIPRRLSENSVCSLLTPSSRHTE